MNHWPKRKTKVLQHRYPCPLPGLGPGLQRSYALVVAYSVYID